MKGYELTWSNLIIIVLMIAVIFVIYVFASNTKGAQGMLSSKMVLMEHCKEWQDAGCSRDAMNSIMIDVENGQSVSFADLCDEEYGTGNGYDGCKSLCVACPSSGGSVG